MVFFSSQSARYLLLFAAISSVKSQTACTEGAVGLIGLGVNNAGIVIVCVGGVWGTVCTGSETTPWSAKNSQVACRKAGFAGAVSPILQSTLSTTQVARYEIHYDKVVCKGYESNLANCSHSTSVSSSCTHDYDAAVTCKPYSDDEAVNGDVRLLGDEADGIGAVEYYDTRLGGWTGICLDAEHSRSWISNSDAAAIVCRQLGYDGGTPIVENIPSTAIPVKNTGELSCISAQHFNLSACPVEVAFCEADSVNLAGGVRCVQDGTLPDYSLRLEGGDGSAGVVEVVIDGRWGTICGDLDLEDATTVCRTLDLPAPHEAIANQYRSYHGLYDKPSWIAEIGCDGEEDDITDCSISIPIGYTPCSGTDASSAEVSCVPMQSDEGGLSGGAIAGIVIGVLVGIGILGWVFHILKEGEKKKKAAAAAPRIQAEQQRQAAEQRRDLAAQQRRDVEAVRHITVAPAQQPPAPAESQPPAEDFVPNPDSQLASAAPPSYSAAISYPMASGPPSYATEKPGPYPPTKFESDLPYPTSMGFDDSAYPPAPSAPTLADYPAPTNPAYPPRENTFF